MISGELSAAVRELAGTATEFAPFHQLGPGALYLLDLPDRRVRYIDRQSASFPNSFFSLVDTLEKWDDLLPEEERAAFAATFDHGELASEARYTVQINRRGATAPVVDYRQPLRDSEGRIVGLLGKLVDDSFRAMAMDSLFRRSWKEIATTMTRRLLHDFNNTIAGIYSLSELYAEPGSDAKSMVEAMVHIRDCSVRAQEITQKIRHLSTLERSSASYYNLATLVREQDEYLQALLPKGAEIAYELEEGELPALLDANEFRQTVLHIAANACDAAGEEVTLKIRLRRRNGPKTHAILEIQDNGPGFKDGETEQASLPFFTTKDSGKHPGLGLSIAASFARALGGALELENAPQGGAVIRLSIELLPQDSPAPQPRAPARAPDRPSPPSAVRPTKPKAAPLNILVYSWEDITRHPLLLAMAKEGWQTRVHLDPGQLLVDLLHSRDELDGVLLFKSALDERVEPLISELGYAKIDKPIALLALGESVEAIAEAVKRNCGLILPGASKPSALLSKLDSYFR